MLVASAYETSSPCLTYSQNSRSLSQLCCSTAGTEPDSSLFMPMMAAGESARGAESNPKSKQQKHSLQSGLHTCNLQLDAMGLQVLTEEFTDIPSDDKPNLHKMLQVTQCGACLTACTSAAHPTVYIMFPGTSHACVSTCTTCTSSFFMQN